MSYINRSANGRQYCVAVFDDKKEAEEALPVIQESDPTGHFYITSTPTPMQALIETMSNLKE